MIDVEESFTYWNYFIALEEDLYKISRYIEFNKDNFKTYSIELAKLLISASSQVDVVLRDVCSKYSSKAKKDLKIGDFIETIEQRFSWINTEVQIIKHGLKLCPFDNLKNVRKEDKRPKWWTAYNKIKHNMDTEYNRANLKNTLNSMGALFLVIHLYYYDKYSHLKDTLESNKVRIKYGSQQKTVLFSSKGLKKPF